MKLSSILKDKRPIYRVYITHTLRSIALSIISIYVPIFLFTLGHSLADIILFYTLFHVSGLLLTIFVFSKLIEKFGPLFALKVGNIAQVLFFLLLLALSAVPALYWGIAVVGGIATFAYWLPLNMILLRNADFNKMGSDLGKFFALPKAFKIVGPLLSAALIPFVGFWPIFILASVGVVLSYFPLVGIQTSDIKVTFRLKQMWMALKERGHLFVLEGFDNVLEESEWFWGIYVYLLIGSLATPGIVGSLEAIGGALFIFFVGKHANKHAHKMILMGAALFVMISIFRIYIEVPVWAYVATLAGSFAMTFFFVPYTATIYRAVKHKNEEEFIILREIPTVLGRVVMFSGVLLTVSQPNLFFLLPAGAMILFIPYFLKKRMHI